MEKVTLPSRDSRVRGMIFRENMLALLGIKNAPLHQERALGQNINVFASLIGAEML